MEPVVSAEEVRARWAYSELLSDRPYDDPSVQELKKKTLERFAHEVGAQEPKTFEQWIEAEPIRSLEPGHARYATSGAPRSAQGEPLIVGRLAGLPTLLDGYHRAVRFWKRATHTATLLVYVPCAEAARTTR
jgi:hypothetical protein